MLSSKPYVKIIALILTLSQFCMPCSAQDMNYLMPPETPTYASPKETLDSNTGTALQNTHDLQPGSIQPFENSNYPPAFNSPSQNPNYPPSAYTSPSQNPNHPPPAYTPPSQNPNYPPSAYTPPSQNPNYPPPAYTPPSQNPNYPPPAYTPPSQSPSPKSGNLSREQIQQTADLTNEAYKLTKSGNSSQAIGLLKQAISIDPSSCVAHLDLSVALIALKRYDEALKESSIVLQLDPDEEKGYLNYLAAAIGANHMQDALHMGQEYLHRFPNGKNRTTLCNEMVAVAQEVDRRSKTRGITPPPGAPDNYLFLVTPYGKRRWASDFMPLKVYIYPGQNFKDYLPNYQSILIKSFLTWQNASHGLVRFVPVDNPLQANIECHWTDSAADLKLAAEAGDTHIYSDRYNNIRHVIITLLTCRPDLPAEKLSLNLMHQVCLHEVGHALGIDGHSDNAQDIMYCATDPNVEIVELSQRDLNTLFLIYQ